jgi:hypothetical protein
LLQEAEAVRLCEDVIEYTIAPIRMPKRSRSFRSSAPALGNQAVMAAMEVLGGRCAP